MEGWAARKVNVFEVRDGVGEVGGEEKGAQPVMCRERHSEGCRFRRCRETKPPRERAIMCAAAFFLFLFWEGFVWGG